jgi:hypothetical protein
MVEDYLPRISGLLQLFRELLLLGEHHHPPTTAGVLMFNKLFIMR